MAASKYLDRLDDPKVMDVPLLSSNESRIFMAHAVHTLLEDEGLERAIPALAPIAKKMKADSEFITRLKDLADADADEDDTPDLPEHEMRQYISPFLEALEKHISPQQKIFTKEGKQESFLAWYIVRMNVDGLKGNPYGKAEDLYKLREDLTAWDKGRKNLGPGEELTYQGPYGRTWRFGTQDSIFDIEDMDDLVKIAAFENQKKTLKKEFRETMRIGSKAPATLIYDGPEGTIVVPQTMESCQSVGDKTRWCIAAKNADDNMFDPYNLKAPIFVFIPKIPDNDSPDRENFPGYSSFKIACTNGVAYDELDNQPSKIPECVTHLRKAAERTLSGGALDYFRKFSDPSPESFISAIGPLPRNAPDAWKPWLEKAAKGDFSDYPPDKLNRDVEFLLAAIQVNPETFQWASEHLEDYPPFIKAAAKTNPACITEMQEKFQNLATHAVLEAVKEGKIPPPPRLIHRLPAFYGGPLTTDTEEIRAHLQQSEQSAPPPANVPKAGLG